MGHGLVPRGHLEGEANGFGTGGVRRMKHRRYGGDDRRRPCHCRGLDFFEQTDSDSSNVKSVEKLWIPGSPPFFCMLGKLFFLKRIVLGLGGLQ